MSGYPAVAAGGPTGGRSVPPSPGASPVPHRPASQPAADRRSVREQALQTAALELFTQRGYEATTMADIGAAIGIRGPSLYKYVSSKQDLLAQVMTQTMENLLALHRKAVAGTEDVTQRLRRAA